MVTRGRADAEVFPAAPSWLRDVPLAHRGLHDTEVPENSLAAFEAAAAAGYGVELDVQLSADGVPVVFHDLSLARLTGDARDLEAVPAAGLAALRLGDTSEHIPTLAEVLAALSDAPVMIEVKQRRLRAGRLERAVAEVASAHDGPWCMASFNPASVRFFRRHLPDAVRVLTATHDADPRLPAVVRRRLAELRDLPGCAPHGVSYDLDGLPNPSTAAWRDAGRVLVTWTAVGDDAVARARELADNVIFEASRPELAAAADPESDVASDLRTDHP
jgi:glycerophosphoryl diester phosphodiesterase